MDLGKRIRIGMASGVVLTATAAIALAGTVQAGDPAEPLQPDLKTVAAGSFGLDVKSKGGVKATLRISNKIANAGDGPLELYAAPATADGGPGGDTDCTEGEYEQPEGADRDANQAIYEDTNENGEYDEGVDQLAQEPKVGCFEYHGAHDHWHFQDFSQYRLDDVATGEPLAGPSRKIGFCILDGDRKFPDLPGSPASGQYPTGNGCAQGDSSTSPGPMGLSVGWADIYSYSTPGQRLDISGVGSGTYCLVSIANPPGGAAQIVEEDLANNERRRQIKIDLEGRKAKFTGASCPDPSPKS
jgi:hypothetical protein